MGPMNSSKNKNNSSKNNLNSNKKNWFFKSMANATTICEYVQYKIK